MRIQTKNKLTSLQITEIANALDKVGVEFKPFNDLDPVATKCSINNLTAEDKRSVIDVCKQFNLKPCFTCMRILDLELFSNNAKSYDGKAFHCKECIFKTYREIPDNKTNDDIPPEESDKILSFYDDTEYKCFKCKDTGVELRTIITGDEKYIMANICECQCANRYNAFMLDKFDNYTPKIYNCDSCKDSGVVSTTAEYFGARVALAKVCDCYKKDFGNPYSIYTKENVDRMLNCLSNYVIGCCDIFSLNNKLSNRIQRESSNIVETTNELIEMIKTFESRILSGNYDLDDDK